jgi:hypothetical protein
MSGRAKRAASKHDDEDSPKRRQVKQRMVTKDAPSVEMKLPSLRATQEPIWEKGTRLAVFSLGKIDPRFHNELYAFPLGYTSERRFHSHLNFQMTSLYRNEVLERDGAVMFKVTSLENGDEFMSPKPTGAISEIMSRVEKLKHENGFPMAKVRFSGPDWFGFYLPEVARLIQDMPEIAQCSNYVPQTFTGNSQSIFARQGRERSGQSRSHTFVMGTSRERRPARAMPDEILVPEPPPPPPDLESGCARLEPFQRRGIAEKFNTYILACVPPQHVEPRPPVAAHRVAHADAPDEEKYSKHAAAITQRISFGKSSIHGYGVFARVPIAANEIIVEYTGELIRQFNTDVREMRYRRAGKDCYMFRISADTVIDATDCGNLARLINHSCNPNCYSRQITVGTSEHIVIESLRTIYAGEELTYDYQFPFEEDKVKCFCRAPNCRGTMN